MRIFIKPNGDFNKAKKWAEQYKDCSSCKFMGVEKLVVNNDILQLLIFDTPYDTQFVVDTTSIDGRYYIYSKL